jgi:hypothetical protein
MKLEDAIKYLKRKYPLGKIVSATEDMKDILIVEDNNTDPNTDEYDYFEIVNII